MKKWWVSIAIGGVGLFPLVESASISQQLRFPSHRNGEEIHLSQAMPKLVPGGFEAVKDAIGVTLWSNESAYLQTIDLSQGASVKFRYGKIVEKGSSQGVYGGDNPEFERQTLAQAWSKFLEVDPSAFCIANGQFFRNNQNLATALAFPVKADGKIISDGYAGIGEYAGKKLMLEVWSDRASISSFNATKLYSSTAPHIIVGLTEDADKGIENEVARTFIGVKDSNADGIDETLLIFTAKSSTQPDAARVLREFGSSQVMMLDGGGSTQLFCQGTTYINSTRTIPQAIAISSALPLNRTSAISLKINEIWKPFLKTFKSPIFMQDLSKNFDLKNQWIVSAQDAKKIIDRGATILDTRNKLLWALGHVPGGVQVSWQQFSQPNYPHKGKLLENPNLLTAKLQKIGISNDRPVIVVGNPLSWGEEGRIVWMLRSLGHTQAAWVDGGHSALVDAGFPLILRGSEAKKGDFVVSRTDAWEIDRDGLKNQLNAPKYAIVDTRGASEYAGKTPYGEQRGGHIPGAKHLYFKELLDDRGNLLPRDRLLDKLESLGLSQDTAIAAYCTGGVRSAFVVSVLADLGFTNVKNYAGSMWEWSAAPTKDFPLEK